MHPVLVMRTVEGLYVWDLPCYVSFYADGRDWLAGNTYTLCFEVAPPRGEVPPYVPERLVTFVDDIRTKEKMRPYVQS